MVSAAPGPARRIPRPTLFERLETASRSGITVVTAPAGSGKSVLVRAWLDWRGQTGSAAWVSVERGERDEQRFWSSVVAELRTALPSAPALDPLQPTPAFDSDATVRRLLSQLESLSEHAVLVIDDVHEIGDAALLGRLAFFLERLPGELHVVLISRRDLQLGLHRRRLEGRLTELRNDDLRFTLDETVELVRERGVPLSAAHVAMLHERTEGWIAGLILAMVSFGGRPDPDALVEAFSGSERTVAEYLIAEVLDGQSAQVRRLLLRASLLDRVNGELGDLITGHTGSQALLRQLADDGAFVIAVDSQRTWFRFHHLFADLLGLELRHTEPASVAGLHRAAATWFAEHGLPVEAIAHAQSAGDDDLAAGMLIQHYFSLALDGRRSSGHALIAGYVRRADDDPPEFVAVLAADELFEGSLEQAALHLVLAEGGAARVPAPHRRRFAAALLLIRLTLARRLGDFRAVVEVDVLDALDEPRVSSDIAVNNDVQTLMLMSRGIVEVWSGLAEVGATHLAEARRRAHETHRPYLEVGCLAHWAQAVSWTSFGRARVACQQAIALAQANGWGEDPVLGPALITLAAASIQAGRLDEGADWLRRADDVLASELEPALGFVKHLNYAALHLCRGQYRAAISDCHEAERLHLRLLADSPLRAQLQAALFYAQLNGGDVTQVREALAAMADSERDRGELREISAALALKDGDPTAALQLLGPTLDGASAIHHPVVLVRSLLAAALAHEALDETSQVEAMVERALELADNDTLILPFLFLRARTLLERHPRHRTRHGAFVRAVLDALSGSPTSAQLSTTAGLDALSEAELRLLRYLPSNLTVSAIAELLSVTPNTAKTHLQHIYAKLGAHTRAEALERARAHGLLGSSVPRP